MLGSQSTADVLWATFSNPFRMHPALMSERTNLSWSRMIYKILEQPVAKTVLWIGRTEVVFCWESHFNQPVWIFARGSQHHRTARAPVRHTHNGWFMQATCTATDFTCHHLRPTSTPHFLSSKSFWSSLHSDRYLQICDLLKHHTAYSGTYLRTFRDNLSVPSSKAKKYRKKSSRLSQDSADESWACCVCSIRGWL